MNNGILKLNYSSKGYISPDLTQDIRSNIAFCIHNSVFSYTGHSGQCDITYSELLSSRPLVRSEGDKVIFIVCGGRKIYDKTTETFMHRPSTWSLKTLNISTVVVIMFVCLCLLCVCLCVYKCICIYVIICWCVCDYVKSLMLFKKCQKQPNPSCQHHPPEASKYVISQLLSVSTTAGTTG